LVADASIGNKNSKLAPLGEISTTPIPEPFPHEDPLKNKV